jgi:hypothetical protein
LDDGGSLRLIFSGIALGVFFVFFYLIFRFFGARSCLVVFLLL